MTAAANAPSTRAATEELAAGRPVLLVDDVSELGGVLVLAADTATTATTAFLIHYTAGYLRVAISAADADRLRLPPMWPVDSDDVAVDAVTVDAWHGTTTGISAHDRACTLRTIGSRDAVPEELTRPGHVVPVRIAASGSRSDDDIGAFAHDLAQASGANAAAYCAVVGAGDDTALAGGPELSAIAADHDLVVVGTDDIRRWGPPARHIVERVSARDVAFEHAGLTAISYHDTVFGLTHLALVRGDPRGRRDVGLLVRSIDPVDALLGSGQHDAVQLLRATTQTHAVLVCLDAGVAALSGAGGRPRHADKVRDAILSDLHIASTQPICGRDTS